MTSTKAAGQSKETIYIDVDDEITAIIEKVQASDNKIVALVLPKRAVVLQSIVNMKLLKRTADEAKKSLVLITSEAGLLPLAGVVGLHVAKSLQSKPAIPKGPDGLDTEGIPDDIGDDLADQEDIDDFDPGSQQSRTIGDLATASAAVPDSDDTIELDGDDDVTDAVDDKKTGKGAAAAIGAKKAADKKLKIPNFNRFRKLIIFGSLALLLLIGGGIYAFVALPKATITIATDSRDIRVSKNFTASVEQTTVDTNSSVLPAKLAQQQKTQTETVPATGEKNNGEKAEGEVIISAGACSATVPSDVPTGTGVSFNGKTYITQNRAQFEPSISGGSCTFRADGVEIIAQSGGAAFNAPNNTNFTVAGRSNLTARGSAKGGTDQIVKVIAQSDVDAAKAKLSEASAPDVAEELSRSLSGSGWKPVAESLIPGEPQVTTSAAVGVEADTVAVTQVVTYSMIGVKQSDLKTLITDDVKEQIEGDSQQNIGSDGAGSATFAVVNNSNPNSMELTVNATAVVGPAFDEDEIKKQSAGKKAGDIKKDLESIEGVESVSVEFGPFWVNKVPGNADRVTVVIEKSGN